jgi:hypothetical protein
MTIIYDSGPPIFPYGVGSGLAFSDGVTAAGTFALVGPATIEGVAFASNDLVGGVSSTVTWGIYTNVGGTVGSQLAGGTASSSWINVGMYDTGGFSITPTSLGAGSYFLAIGDPGNPTLLPAGFARAWTFSTPSPTNFAAAEVNGVWESYPLLAVSFQLLSTPFV